MLIHCKALIKGVSSRAKTGVDKQGRPRTGDWMRVSIFGVEGKPLDLELNVPDGSEEQYFKAGDHSYGLATLGIEITEWDGEYRFDLVSVIPVESKTLQEVKKADLKAA